MARLFDANTPLIATRIVSTKLKVSDDALASALRTLGIEGEKTPTGRVTISLKHTQRLERHFLGNRSRG